jgi:CRISPR-associated protein Cas2
MRSVYIICYDIADPKRWRQVYKRMCGIGDPLQYSVFRCELTAIELQIFKDDVWRELKLSQDRLMIVDLGPIEGRGDECIEYWGTQRSDPPNRSATII